MKLEKSKANYNVAIQEKARFLFEEQWKITDVFRSMI